MDIDMKTWKMQMWMWFGMALMIVSGVKAWSADPPWTLVGDWQVRVDVPGRDPQVVTVQPPLWVHVEEEKISPVPVFNPQAGGWVKGAQLQGVRAQETTTPFLLDPASLVLKDGVGPSAAVLRKGVDYEVDPVWGTVGRKSGGSLRDGQPIYASYRHAQLRLDAVVLDAKGEVRVETGTPKSAAPSSPPVSPSERHLGNIWIPGVLAKLGAEHLFPILERSYPEKPRVHPSVAERLIPKTMAKLRSGAVVKILAWGDSVTVGTYVADPEKERWQAQFVARLRERFPTARVELVTEAWGGRNTASYLNEPPGSEHHYQEKVLAVKPDLIVSEFVNDAGLNPAQVEERYGKLLKDFQAIGAEWIILTPHYVRPDWMGLNRERDIDEDPRPYVAGLRAFAEKHQVALADASLRYGRLWRQGIPYTTVMLNSINHPDGRGMKLFADALMELFP